MIYVLSHGHSGSTLLGLLLGIHPEVSTIGEVFQIRPGRRVACGCRARPFTECEYWGRVGAELDEACSLDLCNLTLDDADPTRFRHHNLALFRAVQRTSGCSVLVDTSKSRERLSRLLEIDEIDVTIAALQRDARGVVFSNLRKERGLLQSVVHYGRTLLGNAFFLRKQTAVPVYYEQLIASPESDLKRLFDACGIAPLGGDIALDRMPRHSVGGNRMRFVESHELRHDESWRDGLSPIQRAVIATMTVPCGIAAKALGSRRLRFPHDRPPS